MSYSVNIDDSAIAQLMSSSGIGGRAADQAAGRVRDRARDIITREGRVDNGTMRQSVEVRIISRSGSSVRYEIGTDVDYAIYQHEGTEGPIYPRRATVLRFKPKGSSAFVFRPSVSGVEGIHFLTRALDELTLADFAA